MDDNELAACRCGCAILALLIALYFKNDLALMSALTLISGALIPVQHIATKLGFV